MRRPILTLAMVVPTLLLGACQDGDEADPFRDSATVSETLPDDTGDLDNPREVTSPGGGAGETE